ERDRNEDTASRRSSRPSVWGGGSESEAEGNETREQKRAAGTKKTALFDIVNRKTMRAGNGLHSHWRQTCSVPGRARDEPRQCYTLLVDAALGRGGVVAVRRGEAENVVEVAAHGGVAFACGPLQPSAVHDMKDAAAIADHAGALQQAGGQRHG